MTTEHPFFVDCAGERMLGILHRPGGDESLDVGVLIVVGGPQYRVGSHRQFVLLARALAAAGVPVLRFDYRGMGDSTGEPRDFEHLTEDIRAAVNAFVERCEGLRGVVLWGLCDAATANAFYAHTDARIIGQIALNPWVRTTEGEAQAFIRHYYLRRVLSRDFWRKVFGMRFNPIGALQDFSRKLGASRGVARDPGSDRRPLPERLFAAQANFRGPTLLILSGQDLTAREYEDRVSEKQEWRGWLNSADVSVRHLQAADHTFSRAVWRDQVANWSLEWVRAISGRTD